MVGNEPPFFAFFWEIRVFELPPKRAKTRFGQRFQAFEAEISCALVRP